MLEGETGHRPRRDAELSGDFLAREERPLRVVPFSNVSGHATKGRGQAARGHAAAPFVRDDLWLATGLPDDRRGPVPPGHQLRESAERALGEQDSWTADEHRSFWRALLPAWPRQDAPRATGDRLGSLAVYLLRELLGENEAATTVRERKAAAMAVASALGVAPDTLRRRYMDRGVMRESEVTFAAGLAELPLWRVSRTDALDGARPLPRVQTTEPVADDEPAFPDYYVAVADPFVPPAIRVAFVNAHEVAPHESGLIGPAPVEHRSPDGQSEVRPWCPIGARLGIDGPRVIGWRWEDDWPYRCPSWQAAREQNARACSTR